jgi:hypothetical protein
MVNVALAPSLSGPVSELKTGGPLKDLIVDLAKRLGLGSHVSIRDEGPDLIVTVTFPPHAVTRRIPGGPGNEKDLTELTVLLIEMSRYAGSLTPAKREQRVARRRGA